MPRDPRVDSYIASKGDFAKPILTHLRDLIHARIPDAGEDIKWSMPFFTYKGELLANMAAFKAHAAFGFWNRQELKTGREGDAMGQYGRITSRDTMPDDTVLLDALDRAVAMIDAGVKPQRPTRASEPEAEVPAELAAALAGDAAASAKWEAFPPGCRREYCEWIAGAKRDETRAKRIAQTIEQVRDGKKINWKYENC
ncbi:MAG: YdeI/OmpD-associated family protein [Sphingomonas sp.]|uniref:YdeI/OmpD-associated family protein n=1 Tax=Sphingomonas sp. TaxID=28214 RepID=UPI001AD239EB|nr:YdeI/OmpD-associated family protein [Sphingomonas sp.]MBN8814015.1 YdeI/OmpD-associated family protein [Sphingomonas sp.]